MARIDSRPRLGEIAVPTLLIWGEKDGITSRAHHGEIADAIPGARLEVVPVPTHRPIARNDEGDLIYKTEDGKFQAGVEDIAERHTSAQPVLVGTIQVATSATLSRLPRPGGIIPGRR